MDDANVPSTAYQPFGDTDAANFDLMSRDMLMSLLDGTYTILVDKRAWDRGRQQAATMRAAGDAGCQAVIWTAAFRRLYFAAIGQNVACERRV